MTGSIEGPIPGPIQVWGRATSSNVQAVMWTLAELGLSDRVTRHDRGHSHGGLDAPEYLAMNPHGVIPTLQEGDAPPIWESGAIVRYLAARHGDARFWPTDPAERAPLDMWAEWVKTTLGSHFALSVFWPLIRSTPATRDAAALAVAVERLGVLLGRLDARYAEGPGPHLTGPDLTFADIQTGHLLYRIDAMRAEGSLDLPPLPALDRAYAALKARPAYAEHVMVSYEPLRAPA